MPKTLKLLILILASGIALVAIDQLLLRVPLPLPGVTAAQTFYVDFRSRLLELIGFKTTMPATKQSIEQVIEANTPAPAVKPPANRRYLYVDDAGALQFADSLSQVPARFRQTAQPLAE